jgi:Bifunctional DNA primase/polymerase, N-terminal
MSDDEGRNLRAAQAYARAGWPVFPLIPGEKVPLSRTHGFQDASTNPEQVADWWGRNPGRNVGIATGAPGPDVLDVDQHGEAGNGFGAFQRLQRAGLVTGASALVRTPSGGFHAYYTGTDQRSGKLPAHHLDFRAQGGYIVAPPSRVGGKEYELAERPDGVSALDWGACRQLLEPERERKAQRGPERTGDRPADVERLAAFVAKQEHGNRNDGLFWAACRAHEAGLLDDPAAMDELVAAALRSGLRGGEREARRTIASAQQQREPWRRPDPTPARLPEREREAG